MKLHSSFRTDTASFVQAPLTGNLIQTVAGRQYWRNTSSRLPKRTCKIITNNQPVTHHTSNATSALHATCMPFRGVNSELQYMQRDSRNTPSYQCHSLQILSPRLRFKSLVSSLNPLTRSTISLSPNPPLLPLLNTSGSMRYLAPGKAISSGGHLRSGPSRPLASSADFDTGGGAFCGCSLSMNRCQSVFKGFCGLGWVVGLVLCCLGP